MRHLLFFILIICVSANYSKAQEKIEVLYEKDTAGKYIFYCTNENYCTCTIEIYFEQLFNLECNVDLPYKTEVVYGRNRLFTLETIDPSKSSTFKYSYKYVKGCVNPKIDNSFTYLLPIAAGKETEPFSLTYFQINEQYPEPKDYYAVGFKTNIGDTIFAARRGIVSAIRDTANLKFSDYSYSSVDNYIEIFHKDCSFGMYKVFKKSLVSLGQTVEAGDPIAIAGGDKYISGPHFRFWVYYNYEQKLQIKNKDGNSVIKYWAYVPLVFYTKEKKNVTLNVGENYTSIHPDSLIIQEMTKRQIKKWQKKNHSL